MQNVFVKARRTTSVSVGDLLWTTEWVGSVGSDLQLLEDLNKLIFVGDLNDRVGHLENDLLLELLEILLSQVRHGEEPGQPELLVPAG